MFIFPLFSAGMITLWSDIQYVNWFITVQYGGKQGAYELSHTVDVV